jgi:hypothetical protein
LSPANDDLFGVYLDDCAFAYDTVNALTIAGFRVVTPAEAGLSGAPDRDHLAYTARTGLALITKNPEDFLRLHDQSSAHAGVLLIYQDNDVTRDMRPADVARTVRNLLDAGLPIAGHVHVLNHWRY